MPGLGENDQAEPVERAMVYTATGDAVVRQKYKDSLLGQVLEETYLIEEVIGWGGMSVVYRARHLLVDRVVAIKTVKFRADERPDIWQRFQREIITLSRLSHPNVVTVYDCVIGRDGQPYVVMDLIQGCTLDDVLQAKGRLPLRQLCSIAGQVASAVEHAHRHDVIHRDLKPANIMILGDQDALDGEVKVVDFGLAKLGEDDQKLTQTGQLWGSPPYISPEQIKGGKLDYRCDIYSLGVVLYEMATGRDPFGSEFIYEMLHHHLHHDPPPFAEICPDAPPPRELEAVVRRAMAKSPADRYQSMADFKEDLEMACHLAENRLAAEAARDADSRSTAARTSTARMPALQSSSSSRLRKLAGPCRAGGQQPFKVLTASNLMYVGLSALLIVAASVMAMRHSPSFAGGTVTSATPLVSSTKPETPVAGDSGKISAPTKIAPVSFPSVAKVDPAHLSSHKAGHLSSYAATRLTSRYGLQEHAQVKHSPILSSLQHRPIASANSVKKSLPNASQLPVDQSKFDVLRGLRSPGVRQECGDLPQH